MSSDLFEAIAAGDDGLVRELVEARPELAEAHDGDGLSAVRRAVYARRDEIAEILLDANPALDVFDAAAVGRTRGLEALLGERSLAQAWSSDGFTALHLAAFFGHEDAAALLLAHGADANAVARNDELRVTPLHSAAAGAHASIVKLLLEQGADPNARQGGGFTALHAAASNGDRESMGPCSSVGRTRPRERTRARRPPTSPQPPDMAISASCCLTRLPERELAKAAQSPRRRRRRGGARRAGRAGRGREGSRRARRSARRRRSPTGRLVERLRIEKSA